MVSLIRENSKKTIRGKKKIDTQYQVQYNADVAHQYVRMYCNTNQFPALPICGPH